MVERFQIVFKLQNGKKDIYNLSESMIQSRSFEIAPIPDAEQDRMRAIACAIRDWLRDMGGASVEAKKLGKKA